MNDVWDKIFNVGACVLLALIVVWLAIGLYSYYSNVPYCVGNFETKDKVILRNIINEMESIHGQLEDLQNGLGKK